MTTNKNPRQAQIESAQQRGADRATRNGDAAKVANDLYPDDTEKASAFIKGWNSKKR